MTKQVKKDIINYLEAIGGIKTIYHKDRIKYLKALIQMCNSLEKDGLYDKMKISYFFSISKQPFMYNSK
jgi:hypothetical protein